jgi:hypothetical protein
MTKAPEEPPSADVSPELGEVERSPLFLALTHPKFLKGARAIARHTRLKKTESGLAVYRQDQSVLVSEPDLPPSETFSRGFVFFGGHNLLLDERLNPRRDILLFIHSHPLESTLGRHPASEMLCPSVGDLESFENIDALNTGHTEGILVADNADTRLLLYKKSQSRDYLQYYKRFERVTNSAKFLATMQEGGLNIATLTIANDPEYQLRAAQAVIELGK